MSYNKVEALREKAVAEKLIVSNDYVGAREKLKKAQQLFPALDHIVPMLAVCEILSASQNIIPGYDIDYYWVLHLMPSSTISDITCQYQKLVSLLQPIKYKFPATESALKLLQEAFSVLSDKKKRVAFDIKRGTSWVDYESFESNPERTRNVESNLVADNNSEKGYINNVSLQESGSSSSDVISEGHKIQDMDMRVDDINSATELNFVQKGVPRNVQQDFYDFDNCRTAEYIQAGDIWAIHHHHHLTESQVGSRYAQIISKSEVGVQVTWLKPIPLTEGERRWFDAGLPVACGSFCLDIETSQDIGSLGVFSYKCSFDCGVTEELFEIYPRRGEVWAVYEDWDLDEWSYNPDVVKKCSFKLVEILSDYSIYHGVECGPLVEVDGFKSIFKRQIEGENECPVTLHVYPRNLYMLSHNVPAFRFTGGEIDGVHSGMFELDQLALQNHASQVTYCQTLRKEKDLDSLVLTTNPESTVLGPNWLVNDFTVGQVWAVYSGKDAMPRQYVVINNMVSASKFCVTLLEPEPFFDHETSWKNRSLPIVCGMFRAGGTTINLDVSQLSHPVNCQKSTTTPVYKIYPSKGEIWAVYRNWKSCWNRLNYDNYKCWVVEVVSDFSDGERMMVARLVEVKGCLTFFQRQQCEDGFEMVRGFARKEMLSFSHQIPSFRVPGIGGHGIPENSWHLEPLALPPNNVKQL